MENLSRIWLFFLCTTWQIIKQVLVDFPFLLFSVLRFLTHLSWCWVEHDNFFQNVIGGKLTRTWHLFSFSTMANLFWWIMATFLLHFFAMANLIPFMPWKNSLINMFTNMQTCHGKVVGVQNHGKLCHDNLRC